MQKCKNVKMQKCEKKIFGHMYDCSTISRSLLFSRSCRLSVEFWTRVQPNSLHLNYHGRISATEQRRALSSPWRERSWLWANGEGSGTSSWPRAFETETERISYAVVSGHCFFATSGGLSAAPVTRILEDNLCRQYYDGIRQAGSPIDEKLCKVDEIQSKLAYLNGLLSTFEAIVGMLFK